MSKVVQKELYIVAMLEQKDLFCKFGLNKTSSNSPKPARRATFGGGGLEPNYLNSNTQNSSHEWEIPHTSLGGGCHAVTGEGLASNKKTSHANPLVVADQLTCHPSLDAGSHEPQTPACCTPPNLPIWGGTTPLQKERRCELC